jgi:hypothetical protein
MAVSGVNGEESTSTVLILVLPCGVTGGVTVNLQWSYSGLAVGEERLVSEQRHLSYIESSDVAMVLK